jgi:hypothetical protein
MRCTQFVLIVFSVDVETWWFLRDVPNYKLNLRIIIYDFKFLNKIQLLKIIQAYQINWSKLHGSNNYVFILHVICIHIFLVFIIFLAVAYISLFMNISYTQSEIEIHMRENL